MSYTLTIPQIILIGRSATYQAIIKTGQNALYPSVITPPDPVMVALITDFLNWEYNALPNTTTLQGTGNYAMWIYGQFQVLAQSSTSGGAVIIGSGGYVYRTVNDTIVTQSPTYSNSAFINAKDFGTLTVDNQEYQLVRGDFTVNITDGYITLNPSIGNFLPGDSVSVSFNQKVA